MGADAHHAGIAFGLDPYVFVAKPDHSNISENEGVILPACEGCRIGIIAP
jgi:hypothetical protein